MNWLLISAAALVGNLDDSAEPAVEETPTADVVVVVGRPGTDEYAEMFQSWADLWADAAERGEARLTLLGADESEQNDYEQLQTVISEQATESTRPLWLVFIGHGTFDGREAKFNLNGPDVSARELWNWLADCERPVAVINCASSSGAFIEHLSHPDWVVVTSTKNGNEINFARFGGYLAAAIGDEAADLDKDDQVSLLEAFLSASAAHGGILQG